MNLGVGYLVARTTSHFSILFFHHWEVHYYVHFPCGTILSSVTGGLIYLDNAAKVSMPALHPHSLCRQCRRQKRWCIFPLDIISYALYTVVCCNRQIACQQLFRSDTGLLVKGIICISFAILQECACAVRRSVHLSSSL